MNKQITNKSGAGLIKMLVSIPLLLIAVLILIVIFYEARKAYWDYRIEEMCEKDGGADVFKKIILDNDMYKKLGGINGQIPVPDISIKTKDTPYYAKTIIQIFNSYNPKVTKRISKIIREKDDFVLGKQINYSRVGGDFPIGIGHTTSFSCKNIANILLNVERQIFIYNGDIK